jgi:superfamily II DNA or RNA helicase
MGTTMTQEQAGVLTRKLYRLVEVPAGERELFLWDRMNEKSLEGAEYGQLAHSAASGRDPDGNITKSTKLDAILEYVRETEYPIVILTNFVASLHYLLNHLAKAGIPALGISGDDEGAAYRSRATAAFDQGAIRILVANVQTVKVGMNLSRSSCLIFAENSFSGEARIQAEERCTVRGKEAVEILDFCTVADVPGLGEIDKSVLSAVRGKKDFNANALSRPPRK